ncbi:MAG: efflux RND transporter periplasmic adaptor subunit [Bacteroidales bacterium]|nr:efflux RND transporter periplasmic adaptor subunit [Bacteroidales bacterium]
MQKLIISFILTLFLASCGIQSNQDKLTELRKERNEVEQELNNIDKQIAELEKEITGKGGELEATKKTYVSVESLNPVTFKHFTKVQGQVETDNNIMIPVESPGVVTKVYVEKGDKVSEGEVLAQVDASIIKRQIDEIETGLELARTVYERQKRLWDKNIGSEIQYLQAKNNKESLEKKLETVKEQYGKTKIKSPISGTIDELMIKQGEMAGAGMPAMRVVQLSKMKIKTQVSEDYLKQIQKGNKVYVSPLKGDKTYESKVVAVSNVINPDTRTFEIEIATPDLEDGLMPNMIVDLEILDYTAEDALVVPVNVLQKTSKRQFLFIAEKNSDTYVARKIWITPGRTYKTDVEILEGLRPGEKVIIAGYQDLADGEEVTIN